MRDYGKISPCFWTGETGKRIREAGRDAQILAIYLVTCPSSNMIGLYYLPLPTLMHEVGIDKKGALKGLASLSEALFAYYDADSEHVFVPEMAAHQIGEPLSSSDNRVKGVVREWLSMRKSPFFMDFHRRYETSFHLPNPADLNIQIKAPSKPLRSQEQEQEQEQEHEKDSCSEPAKTPPSEPPPPEPLSSWVFPVVGDKDVPEWTLPVRVLRILAESYPGIDLDEQLRKARAWCVTNPTKRKTVTGMPKFLNTWCAKAQNESTMSGNGKPRPASSPAQKPLSFDAFAGRGT